MSDYTQFEEVILDSNFDFDTQVMINRNNLLELDIPVDRFSLDTCCNNYGYRLIDLCKSFDLHIANGRCGNDKFIGNFTTTKNSCVDYVLMSPRLLSVVKVFEVLDFDPILSDIHRTISFAMQNLIVDEMKVDLSTDIPVQVERPVWDQRHKDKFIESIDLEQIQILQTELDNIASYVDAEEEINIDRIVENISNILVDAAKKSDMIKVQTTSNSSNNKSKKKTFKPWYDNDCKNLRSQYTSAKNIYRRCKSSNNLDTLKSASKMYKKEINTKMRIYKTRCE